MDGALQELRRRIAAGEKGSRAGLLRARLRAGEITLDQLKLADYCGDDDARDLLGVEIAKVVLGDQYRTFGDPRTLLLVDRSSEFLTWCDGLREGWGRAALTVAACAAAKFQYRAPVPSFGDRAERTPRTVMLAEEWLLAPTPERANEAGQPFRGCVTNCVGSWLGASFLSGLPENCLVLSLREAGLECTTDGARGGPLRAAIEAALVVFAIGAC